MLATEPPPAPSVWTYALAPDRPHEPASLPGRLCGVVIRPTAAPGVYALDASGPGDDPANRVKRCLKLLLRQHNQRAHLPGVTVRRKDQSEQ